MEMSANRARVQVRFCSHFSFFLSLCLFHVSRFSNTRLLPMPNIINIRLLVAWEANLSLAKGTSFLFFSVRREKRGPRFQRKIRRDCLQSSLLKLVSFITFYTSLAPDCLRFKKKYQAQNRRKMKFLAIESLRISLKLNISAAREQQAVGLGLFNVVASWVMACEYLSLGLHVGNHSRPTPLTIIFYFC